MAGKIAIQSIPTQLRRDARAQAARRAAKANEDERHGCAAAGYGGQLFLMLAGALFLAFNVAPTEEMMLIAYMMSPWHSLALIACVGASPPRLRATASASPASTSSIESGFARAFLTYTIPGYGIALAGQPLRAVDLRPDRRRRYGRNRVDRNRCSPSPPRSAPRSRGWSCRRRGMAAHGKVKAETSLLEWIAAAVGLVLLLAMIAAIGWEALRRRSAGDARDRDRGSAGSRPRPPASSSRSRRSTGPAGRPRRSRSREA